MAPSARPAKRAKLLSDSESSSDEADQNTAANGNFKINEEYAKRFEHNKKREEKDRLEEKYGKETSNSARKASDVSEDSDDSSDDESEDDDAELATKDLDAEIADTLAAIKSKDPRVYDKEIKFYKEYDPEAVDTNGSKSQKPMYLQDYHRRNLMEGYTGDDDHLQQDGPARTYEQEQEDIKRNLVDKMHANGSKDEASDEDDDDLLVTKQKPTRNELLADLPAKQITDADVAAADKDPENYLSNFMASRAWLPTATSRWAAFESDESDDEKRADDFEEAYNMRFEDPEHANEKLKTFSRDAGKYSVRRDDDKGNARKRAREREKERKDEEKKARQEERKRLRDLRVEEAAEKVKKIREAAGLRGKSINVDDWKDVLEGDFDDDKWEQEMQRRFGEAYYGADDDEGFSDEGDEHEDGAGKRHKLKKPQWDDDIDIGDLVPEFTEEEAAKPSFTLSDDEAEGEEDGGVSVEPQPDGKTDGDVEMREDSPPPGPKRKSKKDVARAKADARRAARVERRKIEEIVDSTLPLDHPSLSASTTNQPVAGFRYRETSPTSFGLTARDILFADDTQLNSFAGLKKMAAFRDSEKKRRDKKKYSKKGRLREWRKETFGSKDEPSGGFETVLGNGAAQLDEGVRGQAEAGEGAANKKKRKRSKGKKQQSVEA